MKKKSVFATIKDGLAVNETGARIMKGIRSGRTEYFVGTQSRKKFKKAASSFFSNR